MSHRFEERAIKDIADAAAAYDRQSPGLGRRFIEDIERVLAIVARFPCSYPIAHRSARRALLRRFPFMVFYHLTEGEVIVIAVLPQRVHPRHRSQRLAEV